MILFNQICDFVYAHWLLIADLLLVFNDNFMKDS